MTSVSTLGWFSASVAAHGLFLLIPWASSPSEHNTELAYIDRAETALEETGVWSSVAVELAPEILAPAQAAPDTPSEDEASDDLPPDAHPLPPLAEDAPKPREQRPLSEKNTASPTPPPLAPRPAKAPKPPEDPPNDGDSWISVDDQLPESKAEREKPAQPPEADPLVERLMAAERRKEERRKEQLRRSRAEEAPASPGAEAVSSSASRDPRESQSAASMPDQRNIATAFTRAVTEAEKGNPAWKTQPLGAVGRLRLRVDLEAGRLVGSKIDDGTPEILRHLAEKTLRLIQRGRFAMPQSDAETGRLIFEVDVRLSQQSAVPEREEYGFERPTAERPGRAYFTLPSGRHFEASVKPLPSR